MFLCCKGLPLFLQCLFQISSFSGVLFAFCLFAHTLDLFSKSQWFFLVLFGVVFYSYSASVDLSRHSSFFLWDSAAILHARWPHVPICSTAIFHARLDLFSLGSTTIFRVRFNPSSLDRRRSFAFDSILRVLILRQSFAFDSILRVLIRRRSFAFDSNLLVLVSRRAFTYGIRSFYSAQP